MQASLVVVEIVHIDCIAGGESKNDPLIRPYRHGPEPIVLAFEGVKTESRQVHIFLRDRRVQSGQDVTKFRHMVRDYAA